MTAMRVRELTAAECAVLRGLSRGAHECPSCECEIPMKALAHEMGVSVNSVGTWAKRAYRKLGAIDRFEGIRRHARLVGHVCAPATAKEDPEDFAAGRVHPRRPLPPPFRGQLRE